MSDNKQPKFRLARLYKVAAAIAKEYSEGFGSIKQLVYAKRDKHPRIQALYALVNTLYQRKDEIERLLKKTQLLENESKADPWVVKILITELLYGKKSLSGQTKLEQTIKGYEQIFKAHLSDAFEVPVKGNWSRVYTRLGKLYGYHDKSSSKQLVYTLPFCSSRNMSDLSEDPDIAEVTPVLHENPPLLPAHSKQAAKAIGVLLFFSFLMFSLPFASFFATKYLLQDYFHVTGFTNTVWSVIASVVTVNCIIVVYAYLAYIEPDLDEQGNVIQDGAERPKKE
nr:unnamed protein product [Callosobruchus analis]